MNNIDEIKENIKRFVDYYKEIIKDSLGEKENGSYFSTSEQDLDLRIKGLDIGFTSVFDDSTFDYKYNGLDNTVIINRKYLKRDDINLDNLYMDIALNIIYYNPQLKFSGFGCEKYEALNKGFREIITNNIVGRGRSREYFESDEYVYANLMSRILDLPILWNAFQKNNVDYFSDLLRERSTEFGKKFNILNELANRNFKVRNTKNELSSLDEIEYKLFDLVLLEEPSKEKLDEFMTNMVFSSKIFKDEKKYQRLDRLNFDIEYQNYLESSISNQHTTI